MSNNQLYVYNSLTNNKVPFVPKEENKVKMYVCGPTTYNYIHLGNARPIVVFDTIRRYFQYLGYDVTYVQNFTDVDDKIIKRANEEQDDPIKLAARYINEFFADVTRLNVLEADYHPKVSEHMIEIIEFVEQLIKKGYAYEVDGDVYFSVRKFADYGKLSGRNLDDMLSGARVEVDERKQDPMDFALWKAAKPGEPAWESPWGKGRPGWHIECSAMSYKYLGTDFDIHGGGQDLTFPHHENEIAQTEAMTGEPMARYWLHNGFITINKEKMSKSLNNFFLLRDILDKFNSQVVRFYLLSTHYRSPLDFDDEKLAVAQKGLERLKNAYVALTNGLKVAGEHPSEASSQLMNVAKKMEEKFEEAMNDDFNTALAIANIFDLAREINTYLKQPQLDGEALAAAEKVFSEQLAVLGIDFNEPQDEHTQLMDEVMGLIIEVRKDARANKDFATADLLRDQLKEREIILEDSPQGTNWKYEGANGLDLAMEVLIELRKQAKANKDFKTADYLRDQLKAKGVILEDTPQGTNWKAE